MQRVAMQTMHTQESNLVVSICLAIIIKVYLYAQLLSSRLLMSSVHRNIQNMRRKLPCVFQ